MSFAGEWKRRLQMLFRRGQFQRDLEEEMRLHIELRREQQMAAGLDPDEAHTAAHRRFGNRTKIQEKSTVAWGWNWLETIAQDAYYGVRAMVRTPAVTVVALASLALGIGANTAIYSFLDAVMLRSLPVKNPQQLVKLGAEDWDGITDSFACTELYSYPFYRLLQSKNAVFSDTAAEFSLMNQVHGFVDNRKDSELINVQMVSGTYFQTLGVGPQVGRVIDEKDDSTEGDHPVLVISNRFWKQNLGGDPAVLEHKLRLGQTVFSIVGVAPTEFFGVKVGQSPDAWAPLSMQGVIPPEWGERKQNFSESLYILGRLKPGVSVQQATANVNVLFPEILHSFPDAKLTPDNVAALARAHVELEPMERGLSDLRHTYSQPLKILMITVGLVLLIACANIANLLLARSTTRARELALRQALGAGRLRIMRQLLTESMMLALAGGALGIGFAAAASRVLLKMISDGQETIPLDVSLNWQLLGFTTGVTVCTALLFGTLPALRATRLDLGTNLKSGRGSVGGGRSTLAKVLVIGQVAFSLVLMMAAILFLRTLNNLSRVDIGFNKENVLRLDIDSSAMNFKDDDPREVALYRAIEDRVNGLPGVKSESFSAFTFHEGSWNSNVVVSEMPFDHKANVKHNVIGSGYFQVMGIPLVAGRGFGPQDTKTAQPVAIISEHMARMLFPSGSPIGKTYKIGSPDGMGSQPEKLVVGVAKDVRFGDVVEPEGYIDYFPYTQQQWGFGDFEVRYTGDFGAVSDEVQQAIHAIDRNLPISNVTTFDAQVARSYTNQTMIAKLSAFFGLVAVFLSCIGLYGLMSYMVGRRTGEIGIRMALGAGRGEVGWQVLREVIVWVAAGIALGLPVTFEGGKLVEKMLYGLSANDPLSLMAACVVLAVAGVVAGYLPARRASRVDPVVALRYE